MHVLHPFSDDEITSRFRMEEGILVYYYQALID